MLDGSPTVGGAEEAIADLRVVHAMMRGPGFWHDAILWPEDLASWPNPPVIMLSGDDTIVPSNKIKELLWGAREETTAAMEMGRFVMVWLSNTDHGGFVFEKSVLREVVECVLSPPRPKLGKRFLYKLVYPDGVKPLTRWKRKRKAMGLMQTKGYGMLKS